MGDYKTIVCTRNDSVLTIRIMDRTKQPFNLEYNCHRELYEAFYAARADDTIRIIVLTGTDNNFYKLPSDLYTRDGYLEYRMSARAMWDTFTSLVRLHETIASMEKPVIARVNGDAYGFGSSLVFACDFIIAASHVVIADPHLSDAADENKQGPGLLPGDGGVSLIPLFMTPVRAKEYLMLGEPLRAEDLARMGIINYALPAGELDSKVREIVDKLLAKPAQTLARTKRVVNRQIVNALSHTLDAGVAYEMVDFLQWGHDGQRQSKSLT